MPQRKWLHIVFAALLLMWLGKLAKEIPLAPVYTTADYDPEERMLCWVMSARCAQVSGRYLVLCGKNGNFFPIEECAIADDRGQTLLANFAAKKTSSPFVPNNLTQIHMTVNAIGILLLALMLWWSNLRLAAIIFLACGIYYGIPGPAAGPDAPATYIGALCLALLPTVYLITQKYRPSTALGSLAVGGISYFALGWACFLRQPIGLIGCVCVFVALLGFLIKRPVFHRRRVLMLILGSAALWSCLQWSAMALWIRNKAYPDLPRSTHVASHGIWQTLFHGLGTEPNPWGIQWEDRYGYELAQKHQPPLVYLSADYVAYLKSLYIRDVLSDPAAALRVYTEKFRKSITFPIRYGGINVFVWTIIIVLSLPAFWSTYKRQRQILELIAFFCLSIGLVLAQGVLGIPWGKHLHPAKIVLLLIVACFIDLSWEAGQWKKDNTTQHDPQRPE